MAKADDGGPAFPAPGVYGDENHGHMQLEKGELGMTLRDWFAGQALAGLLGTPTRMAVDGERVSEIRPPLLAAFAYELADAMLKARGE